MIRMAEIVCPKCGASFKAPVFEKKRTGLGITFPRMGKVDCPKCGYEGLDKEFRQ